ncbi:UNVERIFIED_ORG: hypothetical protein J2W87_001578 [Pseudomonas putida]|nr:hypothetical protein [Pseudomonas putida]
MIGGPIPNSHQEAQADINRKTAEYFGVGGQVTEAPSFQTQHPPPRSTAIDPETVLKRRRPSPVQAERKEPPKLMERL